MASIYAADVHEPLLEPACDVLALAARENQGTALNAPPVQCRLRTSALMARIGDVGAALEARGLCP
jgi:hypothetical protein